MSKDDKRPSAPQVTTEEMLAAERDKAAADSKANAATAAKLAKPEPAPEPEPARVKVRALKDASQAYVCGETFSLRQGKVVEVSPGVARLLEEKGWAVTIAQLRENMTAATNALIIGLRSRVGDLSAAATAFTLSVVGRCTSAILETAGSFLLVQVSEGVGVSTIRVDLTAPATSTVGGLVQHLNSRPGYRATPSPTMNPSYPSTGLYPPGAVDIANGKSHPFTHQAFSDQELLDFLRAAVSLHNPAMTLESLPATEQGMVLLKATSIIHRNLAAGGALRRGLTVDAEMQLSLAKAADAEYAEVTKRLAKIVTPPKLNEDRMGTGDAIQGTIIRRSPRAGYTVPARNANPPTNPELYQPSDHEIEDVRVRLTWSQARDVSFSQYELWRSHRPGVERNLNGRLGQLRGAPGLPVQSQYSRAGASRQVFGISFGHTVTTPNFAGFYFGTSAEQPSSSLINTCFVDGMVFTGGATVPHLMYLGEPLEPETEYFYRLYLINWNGEVLPSDEIAVRTRPMRPMFRRLASRELDPASVDVQTGPLAGGTSLTIRGTNFTPGTSVRFGIKEGVVTYVSPTELSVVSPGYVNPDFANRPLDLVLRGEDGLEDIYSRGWTYTP